MLMLGLHFMSSIISLYCQLTLYFHFIFVHFPPLYPLRPALTGFSTIYI